MSKRYLTRQIDIDSTSFRYHVSHWAADTEIERADQNKLLGPVARPSSTLSLSLTATTVSPKKNRQNLPKTHGCRATGCISACLLGKFFSGRLRRDLVGRLRCSLLGTHVFWLDLAYFSGNSERRRSIGLLAIWDVRFADQSRQ